MNFLEKIQNLPEAKKKVILWVSMGAIAFLFFYFYIKYFSAKLNHFNAEDFKEGLKIDELKKDLENLPDIQTQTQEIQTTTEDLNIEESSSSATESLLN
jgi:hypothetical protein